MLGRPDGARPPTQQGRGLGGAVEGPAPRTGQHARKGPEVQARFAEAIEELVDIVAAYLVRKGDRGDRPVDPQTGIRQPPARSPERE